MKRKGVSQEEDVENSDETLVRAARRREKRRIRSERAEWWSTKLHAFCWVVSSILVFHASNFLTVSQSDPNIHVFSFRLGYFLFAFVSLAIFRMAFWFKEGESSQDFEKAHPTFLLATTLSGVACFFALTFAYWPVYRIFTPFLLILFWFGMIMSLHFFP